MAQDLSQQAVMSVDKGEEIVGMWATPQIPGSGIYKLVAKKRKDGKIEWAHFIHRPDGSRKVVFRGEVESKEQLAVVLDAANKHLQGIFGVTLSPADVSMKTLDGRATDDKVH
jgi:hypothetical protein